MMQALSPDVLADAVESIVDHGMKMRPEEACGLILPDGIVFFLTNEAPNKQGSYMVSGEQLEAAVYGEDGVEDHGFSFWDCIIWHTHPSGFIGPSAADLESRRQYPLSTLNHLVVALPHGVVAYF